MDTRTPRWVEVAGLDVAHPEGTGHPALTRRHKVELLKIVAAGIGSTALLTIPLIRLTIGAAGAPIEIAPAAIVAVDTTPPASAGVRVDHPERTQPPSRPVAPPITRAAHTSPAIVKTPSAISSGGAPEKLRARNKSRTLVRFVVGDGRHRVQPFPTVRD